MLSIGPLPIDPPLFLAPMAGVTDRDFRRIIKRIGGVGVVTMEFISSRGLLAGERRVTQLLSYSEEERPLSIQIYGSDPDTMAEAARVVEERGADICDINMGCPANKILRGCSGAALMGDLELAEKIISTVRKSIRIPLTVKFRLGLDERRRNFLDLGKICQDNGVDAVTMHGRTAKQMYRGEVDWRQIRRLKESLTIPVLGNGDVREPEDAHRLMLSTGCDGVMIGRGATRNPWIFLQTAAFLSKGEILQPTMEDRRRLILDHFRAVIDREEPVFARFKLCTFTNWYSRGLPGGHKLRQKIQTLPTLESFLEAIDHFFDQLEIEQAA